LVGEHKKGRPARTGRPFISQATENRA